MNKHPLIVFAEKQLKNNEQKVHLIEGHPELDAFISPLGEYPHAYVLACIMDRQISADKAWIIPWLVSQKVGSFDMETLKKIPQETIENIFQEVSKHRYKQIMTRNFYAAIQRIAEEYDGDARKIWNDTPPSGLIISRFLRFQGVGVKIATMATNILVRQFNVVLAEKTSIDISPDIHILRIFSRLGLISSEEAKEEAIYMAKALNPEYPGIADYSCWYVGRTFCHPQNPQCSQCPLSSFCKYSQNFFHDRIRIGKK